MTATQKCREVAVGLAVPIYRALLRLPSAVITAFALGGCVLSVDPVISEAAATFDARLIGRWEMVGGSDRAVVSRAASSDYVIDYTSEGKSGRFAARLGRLGERLVLDVSPAPADSELEPYVASLLAGHVLLALDVDSNEVRFSMLQVDSLRAALGAGRVALAHSESKDRIVLRGSSAELRAALGPYLRRAGALAQPEVWRRARGQ